MRRVLAAFGIAALVLTGCHKTDAPISATTSGIPAKDPNDFSSLRKFPLKTLTESDVKVGSHTIPVWVMDTFDKRQEGFQWLREQDVQDGHGMIFMFPAAEQQSFWMQYCPMELDIAFIGPTKKILNVVRGKKFDETPLPSKGPSKYVLELKPGEAEKFGVKAGAKIKIPADIEVKQ